MRDGYRRCLRRRDRFRAFRFRHGPETPIAEREVLHAGRRIRVADAESIR
jgi:hypothetical protein